jgi:hypothetical protein
VESTTDTFLGGFVSSDYTNYTPPPSTAQNTTIGPCVVTIITTPASPAPPSGLKTTPLDAGPVLNVSGPNGMMQIPQKSNAYYAMLGGGVPLPPLPFPVPGLPGPTPLWLDAGTYTVDNGGGGADVGSFSTTLTVPAPLLAWTNADSDLTIVRSAGVDIQWTGGDPSNNIEIQGAVATGPGGGGAFTCFVPNNGEFMVTSDVLNLLPATPSGAGPGTVSTLSVSSSSQTTFSASGLDIGSFVYESGATRNVVYQ